MRFTMIWRGVAAGAAMTALLAAAQTASAQIPVDDGDGSPAYVETGTPWQTTAATGSGWNGTDYRFHNKSSAGQALATATWTPTIPDTGAYEVVAVFLRSANRTSRAVYTINHANGSTEVELDQTGPFSGDLSFESLGAYLFNAGTSGNVVMSNTGNTGIYIADAMLFYPDVPPEVTDVTRYPLYPANNNPVVVSATVIDNGAVDTVMLLWSTGTDTLDQQVVANDAGLDGDFAAGDGIYSATIPGQPDTTVVYYAVLAEDTLGGSAQSDTESYTVGTPGNFQLVINEVMASNSFTISDPDFFDAADWVELYNIGPDTADLGGLYLSDSLTNMTKWQFPPGVTLAAGEYLLVWCDNQNFVGEGLHTSFALSANGEHAVIYNAATATVIDSVSFPAIATDSSYARIPDATGTFATTIAPTPGAENQLETRGPMPEFSHASGLYSGTINVTITAPGATTIRYTTNGATPTLSSTEYTAPVAISSTTGLRARAWYASESPSLVRSASYFYDPGVSRQIPIMNIVIDPDDLFHPSTGIYTQFNERGISWERSAHVSLLSPDGTVHESIDAGLRIHGGFSRSAAKKSFRLYFRNLYGQDSWTLPWMERTPAGSIRQLVLRAAGNDGFLVTASSQLQEATYIRDQIMRDWYHQQGQYAADGFFAALYLNGQYWGLYNATERITDTQMDEIFGGGDDYDIVKGTWTFAQKFFTEATDGDLVAWNQFLDWLYNTSDLSTPEGIEELAQRIDLDNFVEWFALNIYCQNEDWPHNNWIASRHRTRPGDKWVFHEWDSEWGLGLRPSGWSSNTFVWAEGSNFHFSTSHNGVLAPLSILFAGNHLDTNRTRIINGILDNPQGRTLFIRAMEDVMNFEVPTAKAIAEFDVYVDQITDEIPLEAARWVGPSLVSNPATLVTYWNSSVVKLRNFLTNRPATIRSQMQARYGLSGTRTINFTAAGPGSGKLRVRGRDVELPWSGTWFAGSDVELIALPDMGSTFTGFTGGIANPNWDVTYNATSGGALNVTLNFGTATPSVYEPNDVIFNEYWIDDNGTYYDSIEASIEGDWFELLVVRNGVDLRGWRVTNNPTISTASTTDTTSLIFPNHPALQNLASGTIILVVCNVNATNDASFPADDLDPSDRRLIFYAGTGHLDMFDDMELNLRTLDEALVLLAPGPTEALADDVGIDFIAEGTTVSPALFFETASPAVEFINPFAGIGGDDGAVFTNDPLGGFNNDNGDDPDRTDFLPGPGGWIVDPPAQYTGDSDPFVENRLTPGAPNSGQDISPLLEARASQWQLY